jgi:hypothetical protein
VESWHDYSFEHLDRVWDCSRRSSWDEEDQQEVAGRSGHERIAEDSCRGCVWRQSILPCRVSVGNRQEPQTPLYEPEKPSGGRGAAFAPSQGAGKSCLPKNRAKCAQEKGLEGFQQDTTDGQEREEHDYIADNDERSAKILKLQEEE